MARRRRKTHNFAGKLFGLMGGAATTGAAAWYLAGEPGHRDGLLLIWLLEIPAYPLVTLAVSFMLPALITGALIPRKWRIKYRNKHGRKGAKSAYIPQRLRDAVYFADRHRCISCKAREDLQVDHMIPWAGGGLTSIINCFTLCGMENRVKSNYSVDRDGYVHYRAFNESEFTPAELVLMRKNDKLRWAAHILAIEKRQRWNLARWLRMAWAML